MKKLQGTPFTIKDPKTRPALTPKEDPISKDSTKKTIENEAKEKR